MASLDSQIPASSTDNVEKTASKKTLAPGPSMEGCNIIEEAVKASEQEAVNPGNEVSTV
jgi:hypothetical protein